MRKSNKYECPTCYAPPGVCCAYTAATRGHYVGQETFVNHAARRDKHDQIEGEGRYAKAGQNSQNSQA